jgi:Tol biopolymer transport system component
VMRDSTVDWNPVWSADGNYLYFSSERGGSMNLWRVAIDEASGEVRGGPEPITAPSSFASHITISSDGRRIAYASSTIENRLHAIDFDPTTLTTSGEARAIARDLRDVDAPDLSPNGDWLVFSRTGQEDILISGPDGGQWRQLTDDLFRDRQPVISPDGTEIAFYSNRGGSYEVWIMGFDGSNLRAVTNYPNQNLRYPFWAPDGERLGYSYPGTSGLVIRVDEPFAEQTPEEFPPYPEPGSSFVPLDWSPDGTRVAGHLFTDAGLRAGVAALDVATGRYEKLTDFGWFPRWMADGEHVVFMAEEPPPPGELPGYLQDLALFAVNRTTKEVTEILARPGKSTTQPALSSENSTLYFVEVTYESDIWLISFEQ